MSEKLVELEVLTGDEREDGVEFDLLVGSEPEAGIQVFIEVQ